MKKKLAQLNSFEMARGINGSIETLDFVQSGIKAREMIPEENVQMAKRSADFLKLAAAADLTPAETQLAIAHFGLTLFRCSQEEFPAKADRYIKIFSQQTDRTAVKRFCINHAEKQEDIFKQLKSRKWHSFGRSTDLVYKWWLIMNLSVLWSAPLN